MQSHLIVKWHQWHNGFKSILKEKGKEKGKEKAALIRFPWSGYTIVMSSRNEFSGAISSILVYTAGLGLGFGFLPSNFCIFGKQNLPQSAFWPLTSILMSLLTHAIYICEVFLKWNLSLKQRIKLWCWLLQYTQLLPASYIS